MADKIVYSYDEMKNAVTTINGIADEYAKIGETFISGFQTATSGWEGDTRNNMLTLINGDINTLLVTSIPGYVKALASLLEQNVSQMEKADTDIAGNVPTTLQQG